jgi:hypothetical protein
MSWSNAKTVLRQTGLDIGQGWQKTIKKLLNREDEIDVARLELWLVEHILCGEKFTKIYPMTDGDRERLHHFFSSLVVAQAPATEAYPAMLTQEVIDVAEQDFSVVRVESNEDGIGLVLSSIFAMKVREEIEFDEFEDPAEMRSKFDEIVGVKFRKVQLFHVIWVPHHRPQLEIRVDCLPGMPEAAIHAHHSRLREIINETGATHLTVPINLFPAVRAFYDDDEDGIVSEITFSTTTSAIKNEKMIKRSREKLDQRKETYHLGGKDALSTDIRLFRITVDWPKEEDGAIFVPSITLAATGPSGRGGSADPVISGAFVGNCIRAADYEFVIERLGRKAGLAEK